jgi:hypothetical protein
MTRKPKFRWGALASALVTVAGVIASPAVLALLPAKAAVAVSFIGVACQAITKPVARAEHERIPLPGSRPPL